MSRITIKGVKPDWSEEISQAAIWHARKAEKNAARREKYQGKAPGRRLGILPQSVSAEKRGIEAFKMHQAGMTTRQISQLFGVSLEGALAFVNRGRRILSIRAKHARRIKGRIDATEPNDPPRGVWL